MVAEIPTWDFCNGLHRGLSFWATKGRSIAQIGDMAEGEAGRWLRDWIKNGVLIEGKYFSPKRKKREVGRVTLNEGQAAEVLGPLYQPPEGEP